MLIALPIIAFLAIIATPVLRIWLYHSKTRKLRVHAQKISPKGKKMSALAPAVLQGFDISGFQVAEPNVSGKQFGIIKSTEGLVLVNQEYFQQLDWLRRNNLIVGHYHFPRWGDMNAEATAFVKFSDFKENEFAAIDVESEVGVPFPADPVSAVLAFGKAFYGLLGFKPLVYLNLDILGRYDWQPVFDFNMGLWIADWNPTLPNGLGPWGNLVAIWQKGDTDQTGGDYDEFEGDAQQLDSYGYHPSQPQPTPTPAPTPTPSPAPAPAPVPKPAYQVYVVQSGDSLSTIADKFGISLQAIETANPQIPDFNLIFPGEHVNVPTWNPPAPPITVRTYQVQPGDSLSAIADKFGISLAALEAANPQIPDFNLIYPGQVITIP